MILIRIPVALRHLAAISLGVAWLAVNAEATQYTWNMQISSGYGMDSQTTWWNHGTLANGSMAWASTNDMRFNGAGTPGSYAAGQSGWVQALRWGDFSAARNVKDILFVTPPQGASQWQLGQREDISGARNGALTVYGNVKVGETNACASC